MDCYTCGKEYTSWSGLVYHKQKVHNYTKVFPSLYKRKIKNATKLLEEKGYECMFCPNRFHKEQKEDYYRKEHNEHFTWIKCKLVVANVEKRCLKIL